MARLGHRHVVTGWTCFCNLHCGQSRTESCDQSQMVPRQISGLPGKPASPYSFCDLTTPIKQKKRGRVWARPLFDTNSQQPDVPLFRSVILACVGNSHFPDLDQATVSMFYTSKIRTKNLRVLFKNNRRASAQQKMVPSHPCSRLFLTLSRA